MDKKPNFKKIEKKWQNYWEKNKIYKFKKGGRIYSIDTPPPYASAEHLHIGHALHYTQFEIISRFRRMDGFNVYFPPCFDNNGLPTEKYVENKFNINKDSMNRSEFIKLCRKEAVKVEKNYSDRFFRALGHAYDWDLLYTTIDPESQKVSQMSFLDLYKKKLVYRAEEPILWCPQCQTALAQAEVEDKPRTTTLNHIYFELEDRKRISIATTRPELLPACVGIFVHPDDKRYKKYVGKKAKVPLFDYYVPIMKDELVDPKFGTGMVMICTFGDTTDIEWWKKHKLPLKICITKEGKLNELAGKYEGLTFAEAKEKMIGDMKAKGLLEKQEPLEQTVGVCWRCNTAIEYIVAKQWFVKVLDFKKEIIHQARKIKWYPAFYRKRFEDWTNNLKWDWCISRQRFYGVPMPIWYCRKCNSIALPSEKDLPIDPTKDKPNKKCSCGSDEFEPEKDVFDTWMTSSMSPEINAEWGTNSLKFKKMFPMSLRPQAQDIIRTWAFYTIAKAYHHFKSIPWKEVMISNFVLDPKGRGMSKSKGNAIWLPDMLEKYNADTIRYWVGMATLGNDLPFQEKEMVHGFKILIKLWNTARFVSMIAKPPKTKPKLEIIDKWILNRFYQVIKIYNDYFIKYSLGKARKEVEMFFMHEFCDYYLEMIKYRLYNKADKTANSAKWTVHHVLLGILKLFAPIIPHITEEIYQLLYKKQEKEKSIHLTKLPKRPDKLDHGALEKGKIAVEIISKLRKYKQDRNISLGAEIESLTFEYLNPDWAKPVLRDIAGTMRIKNLVLKK